MAGRCCKAGHLTFFCRVVSHVGDNFTFLWIDDHSNNQQWRGINKTSRENINLCLSTFVPICAHFLPEFYVFALIFFAKKVVYPVEGGSIYSEGGGRGGLNLSLIYADLIHT